MLVPPSRHFVASKPLCCGSEGCVPSSLVPFKLSEQNKKCGILRPLLPGGGRAAAAAAKSKRRFNMCWVAFLAFVLGVCLSETSATATENAARELGETVMYLPLDERYTTRDAFLNLARVTPFKVLTPPVSVISNRKEPADLDAIDRWVAENAGVASAFVVSLEMYVYGGLIQSRISNSTQEAVGQRLQKLVQLHADFPKLRLYVSAVVMRIPSYNGDFEEPWYWANFGADLFQCVS